MKKQFRLIRLLATYMYLKEQQGSLYYTKDEI